MGMSEPLSGVCPRCGSLLAGGGVDGLCPRCLGALNLDPATAITGEATGPHGTKIVPSQKSLTPAELAPHFPQLEILECLGRGGMGVVYKARQKLLNRLVALKLLAPERVADAKFAQRFTHEAQALAALNHPNIVTIYDFGQAGGCYFLLMEFVDGVNLRQAMNAGRFTPEQALAVVPPVCEALQYAHEHGIVHRDIKPENLLLDKAGRVKIADFGIAKILEPGRAELPLGPDVRAAQQRSPTGPETLASAAGTPQYMAPEQKAHRATDHRADIYSLGVVLYELLTGELPADKLQPPSRKVEIDVRLDEIVLRALEKTPELRYQTAGEFRTQVETVVSTPGSSRREEAPIESDSPKTVTPSRFSRTAIVGACLGVLALVSFPLSYGIDSADFINPVVEWELVSKAVAALGVLCLLISSAFGWIAVRQIRHSAGRLHGLRLAVFDGLLFPLLALDAAIFTPIILLLPKHTEGGMIPVSFILMPGGLGVFTVILAIAANFFIIRAVWRAVNKPLNGAAAKPEPVSPRRKQIVFAGLAVQVIILSLLGGRYFNSRWEQTHWHSMPMQWGGDSPKDAAGALRIAEVKREGRVVIFRIACESGQLPVNFQVSYGGQELESLPLADTVPSVTPLYAHTSTSIPPSFYPGMTLVGASWERRMDKITLTKPGEFTLGFVLPDEARAEMAVQQARNMYPPGRPCRPTKSTMLVLFLQQRNAREKNWEQLQAALMVDFSAAPSQPAPAGSKTSPM